MNYISTRGDAPAVNLDNALLAGLAPDGGLYMPQSLPKFNFESDFAGLESLPDIGTRLLAPFFVDSNLQNQLAEICREAFNFPAPLKVLPDGNAHVLELFHGPTAAFKDYAAQFLAACFARLRANQKDKTMTILVATSGDTGGAVASAFHRRAGFRVVVLYPDGRVSPRQAHQLGAFGDNVQALKVAGTFDDCQALVKQAFADEDLRSKVTLSSANSISLGRLLPQAVYYAQVSLQYFRLHQKPANFVIPTGNLGNGLACVLARKLGLPIGEIAFSTNANRVLPDFLNSGEYTPTPGIATLANAMDVGNPSNLERLRWWFDSFDALSKAVSAQSVSDAEIEAAIKQGEAKYGEVFCPHTATAVTVLERLRTSGDNKSWIVVATAHPAKFDSVVEPLIARSLPVPAALNALLQSPATAIDLAADYSELKNFLQAN